MKTETILNEVERAFGFVAKPKGASISFHKDGCFQCDFLRKDLLAYKGRELPYEAIRCINQEMSCLSASGWRWALPSYLRYCLTTKTDAADMETEFLIYNLGPAPKYQAEAIMRFSALNQEQINCLHSFLLWCQEHERWSKYCPEHIERAINFILTLRA
ncbi:MAG: hypothetical protein LPK18_14990 [Pseudomonadaceae bacterium]|nr:hypothetical protein [Pseudomonadaceae bacterium]